MGGAQTHTAMQEHTGKRFQIWEHAVYMEKPLWLTVVVHAHAAHAWQTAS